jgi:hypothetical protein
MTDNNTDFPEFGVSLKDMKKWWRSRGESAKSGMIVGLLLILVSAGLVAAHWGDITSASKPDYTAKQVIAAINDIRSAKGLAPLSEKSSIDIAARGRANYMLEHDVWDNEKGVSKTPLKDAGYKADEWFLLSTWGDATAQDAAKWLTDNDFAVDTKHQDIGVGVVPFDGGASLLVVAFTAAPQAVVSQTYWFCWDKGDPSPHHGAYGSTDDHYCTDQELSDAGIKAP